MIHIGLVETLFQIIGRTEGADFAVHHDRDAVAILCLVHIVGSHKDGDAAMGCVVDEFPELTACSGIYTTRRFVEEHHARLVEDRDGEGQFLFPTQWQRANEMPAKRRIFSATVRSS